MLLEVSTPLLHLHDNAWLPHQVCEGRAAGVVFLDALLARCACFQQALMAKGLEEVVQIDLSLALLIALDVPVHPNSRTLRAS